MKILFSPAHYGLLKNRGSEIEWAFEITNNLASKYKKSVVVAGYSNVSKTPYRIVLLQPKKTKIDLGLINTAMFALSYGLHAKSLLEKEQFDIHHHVLPFYIGRTFNLAFILSNKSRNLKVIGPIQNILPFYGDNLSDPQLELSFINKFSTLLFLIFISITNSFLQILSMKTLHKANAIIAVNDSVKKELIHRGVSSEKIVVIPAGINIGKYIPTTKKRLNKNQELHIISVGALIERKGFDVFIKGISKALIIDPKLHLQVRIIGDGPQRKKLEMLVSELGLTNIIAFSGLVSHSEMPKRYSWGDVFVTMTRAESFAQMYLEAMASGLAIISTRNFGSLSIVKNNVTGILVDLNNEDQLAQSIIELAHNRRLLSNMKKNTLEEVKKYDWKESIVPQYEVLYTKLINEKEDT